MTKFIHDKSECRNDPDKPYSGSKGLLDEHLIWYHETAHMRKRFAHKCHHMWRDMDFLVWHANKTSIDALEDPNE